MEKENGLQRQKKKYVKATATVRRTKKGPQQQLPSNCSTSVRRRDRGQMDKWTRKTGLER